MTRLEKIARDLAAVLSPQGEADWRRYVGMAEEVGARLCHQLAHLISPEAASIERRDNHAAAKAEYPIYASPPMTHRTSKAA